jgi:ribosome-associated toxin RatA of RatAB toxin-antitoxin module
MSRSTSLVLLVTLVCGALGGGADPSKPHPHQGILAQYNRAPPKKVGISMSGVTDEQLRMGEPVLRLMNAAGGFKRIVSVQDIHAPESVVWHAIMDLDNYPKMVEGVNKCKIYSDKKKLGGERVVCATYQISAAGFKMTYYMKHIYEPSKHCMTFHLDYDRCSELSDTVGYWYVEKLADGWCRVYYSTESQLPRFIPGFAKDMLTKLASKRSTSWVEKQCNLVTGYVGGAAARVSRKRGLLRRPSPKQASLLLAILLAIHAPGGGASRLWMSAQDLFAKLKPAAAAAAVVTSVPSAKEKKKI